MVLIYDGYLERNQAEVVLNWFLFPVKNNCSWFRVLNLLLGHHDVSFLNIAMQVELCCELIAVLIK